MNDPVTRVELMRGGIRAPVRRPRFLPFLVLLLPLLLSGGRVRAQSPDQSFDQANRLYQQNKFTEARDAYEAIVREGFVCGEVYYNLGNAYYKVGDLGKAILNFERALRFMPNDDDLKHNLQLANLMIADRIEATPRLFLWDYWDGIKNTFSLRTLTWMCYGVFVLLAMMISAGILARTYRQRRLVVYSGSFAAVVLIFFVVVLIGRVGDVTRTNGAVVTAKITTVKNSPDEKSSDAFVLHSGVKLIITDSVNDWFKIRLADGKVGWMEMGALEII